MENSFSILEELLRANSEIARFQKNKIRELLTKDFPYSGSRTLVDVLDQINEEILKIFEELKIMYKNIADSPSAEQDGQYRALTNKLINYSKLVWELNTILHRVEQSVRENVAQSTVFLISYLARKYTKNSSFFLTPTTEHNFFYRDLKQEIAELIQDSIPTSKKILKKLDKNFSRLSFPAIYRDNIVTNIVLAHEIGHFITETKSLNEIVFAKSKIKIKEQEYVESVTKILEQWIVELLSDMIGFCLCGPVFFFALAEETLSMFLPTTASDDHPPPKYRLEMLLDEMTKKKFIESLTDDDTKDDVTQIIERIKNYLKDTDYPKTPPYSLALKYIELAKTQIIKIVNNEMKSVEYKTTAFGNDVPKLLNKLKEIIPPCEIQDGKPANIISILNAGMIYKMTWMKGGKYKSTKRSEIDEAENTINSMVLRSIETSVLQDKMLKSLIQKKGKHKR